MKKKIKNIFILLFTGIIGFLFFQTIYSYIYYGISQTTPNPSALYFLIYDFLIPIT